jgi:hypothetical protein
MKPSQWRASEIVPISNTNTAHSKIAAVMTLILFTYICVMKLDMKVMPNKEFSTEYLRKPSLL